MKKLLTLALALVLTACLASAVFAGELGVNAGTVPRVEAKTIQIDGVKDELYNGAFRVMINQFNTGTENDTYGVANLLWAEGSFYLYVEVYDKEVVSTTDDNHNNQPWISDSVEIFFDFGNEHAQLVQQFRVDCDGFPSYYTENGETYAYGEENCADYFNEYAARKTDYGYAIEMYINLRDYELTLGGAIGMNLQINDITADSMAAGSTYAVYNMASDVFNGSWAYDYYDYVVLGEVLSYGDGSISFGDLNWTELGEYDASTVGSYEMRAFCADPMGKYVYGGSLQSSPPYLFQFNAATGEWITEYTFDDDPGAYIKAVAADDRGYVYAGVANKANDGECFMAIVNSSDMSEVSYVTMEAEGKLGCNGVGVVQIGDKYYCYYMTNYDTDRLYRIDVTDVSKPEIDTSFGTDGYIDLAARGFADCAGVDSDSKGNIYFAGNKGNGNKGDTLCKLDFDGNELLSVECTEPWSVVLYNDLYLLTGTRNGADSQVLIYNCEDLSLAKEYTPMEGASGFSGADIANNRIYFCDHGSGTDYIYVSDTFKGADLVTIAPSYIAEREAAAKAAEEAAKKAEEEAAAKAAEEAAAAEAKAAEEAAAAEAAESAGEEAAEAVSDAAEAVIETADGAEEAGGCGSFVGGGFVVLVTLLGCGWMTARKH